MNEEEKCTKTHYRYLNIDSCRYRTTFTKKFEDRKSYKAPDPLKIIAFIPGTITKIYKIKVGKEVKKGSKLLVLEAMKMNNQIEAPLTAKIKKINVKTGDLVCKNQILIELEKGKD
jgi:biotin carboxyl carrier protein